MNNPKIGDRWMPSIKTECQHRYDGYRIDFHPSCTTPGQEYLRCIDCGEIIETRSIEPRGHTPGEWYETTSPTCENPGARARDCIDCVAIMDTELLDPTGHTFSEEFTVDKSPQVGVDGSKSRHCLYCDAVTDDTVIPALLPTIFRLTLDDDRVVVGHTMSDITACSTTTGSTSEITVNGETFRKNQVLEVEFIDDSEVKNLYRFGYNFTNLVKLNRIPEGVTGNSCLMNFLYCCTLFNHPITIPEGVTGDSCLAGFLVACTSFNHPINIPKEVTGTSCLSNFLNGCTSFNQPIEIPAGVSGTSCLNAFLYNCTSFNQPIDIPEGITGNGCLQNFLDSCTSFNQPISIPEGITGGSCLMNFLSRCNSMISSVHVTDNSGMTANNTGLLSTTDSSAPIYTQGVPIIGPGATAFKALFPNRTSTPFRNLK